MGIRDEEHWLSLVDAFALAAVEGGEDPARWIEALAGLAAATRCPRGELIGIGDGATVMFNLLPDFPEDGMAEFLEIGGGSQFVNPRVAAGMRSRPLQTVSEADYEEVRPLLRTEIYLDWAERYEIPFGCQTNLIQEPDRLIGLAVLRSRRDGPTSAEDRRAFAAVSSHVRAAVKTQLLLDGQAGRLLAGALDSLSIAGFVCDEDGQVQACSQPAEALIESSGLLDVRLGRLTTFGAANVEALERAIRRAALGAAPGLAPPSSTVVLRCGSEARPPLVLDVLSLPAKPGAFTGGRKVLVAVRGGRVASDAARMLELAYGLTQAEALVAIEMVRGRSREAVAGLRGVSVGTVRSQLKSIFHKLHLRRESELVALLAPLV
jgi:DNA-binding CsgD family transcriptional regulator/PAS domain-containing protein